MSGGISTPRRAIYAVTAVAISAFFFWKIVKKKKMSFHQSAERGDFVTTLSYASLNGALWAVGSAWATAIREIMVVLIPRTDDNLVVLTELGSASIVTVSAASVAILIMKTWSCCEKRRAPPPPTRIAPAAVRRLRAKAAP